MAVLSIIQKSQLEGALRLDAEYYQPQYLELDAKLERCKHLPLVSYLDYLTDGAHQTPDYQESGILFLSSGLIYENYIDFDSAKFISEKEDKKLKHCKPKMNDILVSKSGKVGTSTVFNQEIDCNLFEGVALLRVKNINPYFLSVFINSRLGQKQIERLVIGISQPHLHLEQVEKIKIPSVSVYEQREIEGIYCESVSYLKKSIDLYRQAENLLLEELGLRDFKADEDLYSVINFSDIKSVNRMDAEYFQPKYERLIAKLKAEKARLLADVLENVLAKFNPLAQSDKIFKYVELSNINGSIGIIDGYTETSGREAPSRAKRVLKKGDVIVSTVEGSLGKVALVHKEQEGYLASTGFFQFRSGDLLPEVLLVVAKSFIFHNQLEQRCAGTILTAVPKDSIKDILVPILPKATQEKIAELVQESHVARKKAKELLEEAKHNVEELIEKQA